MGFGKAKHEVEKRGLDPKVPHPKHVIDEPVVPAAPTKEVEKPKKTKKAPKKDVVVKEDKSEETVVPEVDVAKEVLEEIQEKGKEFLEEKAKEEEKVSKTEKSAAAKK